MKQNSFQLPKYKINPGPEGRDSTGRCSDTCMFIELERERKYLPESGIKREDKAHFSKGKQTVFASLSQFWVLPESNWEAIMAEESVRSRRKYILKYCCEIRKMRSCQKT